MNLERYKANRDARTKAWRDARKADPEKSRAYERSRYPIVKAQRNANRQALSEKRLEYERKKAKTDPLWRLTRNLRVVTKQAIKRSQSSYGATMKRTGKDGSGLKAYIESLFQPGMTWDNYGKWHIDHIKPLASFDLTKESQVNAACHYTNLQPLWAEDNLRKHKKLNYNLSTSARLSEQSEMKIYSDL